MTVGDPVRLRHDTTNPHDVHAVLVEAADGRELGYVTTINGLNARLAGLHPGGVWHGEIADVLTGGETVGLRVKVGRLIGTGPAAFGATLPALRHTTDGIDDAAGTATPVRPGVPAPTPTGRAEYSPTGRRLGTYLETVGGSVRVQTATGPVSYPAAVVRIVDDGSDA